MLVNKYLLDSNKKIILNNLTKTLSVIKYKKLIKITSIKDYKKL